MIKPHIITHRGLEPSKKDFFPESSIEAFEDQLDRGFGLEFDPNFVKNGIVISHDSTLERITDGADKRDFHDVTVNEAVSIQYGSKTKGRMPTFDELMRLIQKSDAPMHAMHVKGKLQNKKNISILIKKLNEYRDILDRIFIFDIKTDSAEYIKRNLSTIHLAPSVAHPYDIKRYNDAVSGTLITIDEAIMHRKTYDWVLLDEWDLSNESDKSKKLHTKENYDKLKNAGFKIALITPELHGTSPGLLGGEAHPDAENKNKLFSRIKEIIALKPDVFITDYPEEVRKLL